MVLKATLAFLVSSAVFLIGAIAGRELMLPDLERTALRASFCMGRMTTTTELLEQCVEAYTDAAKTEDQCARQLKVCLGNMQ